MPNVPHRTLMFVGMLAILGLIFSLYEGWSQYFIQRAKHDMLTRLSDEHGKEHASLLAAQSAADNSVAAPGAAPKTALATPPSSPSPRTAVTLAETTADEPAPDLSKMVPVAEPVAPERVAAANALLQNFWHAPTWEAKTVYVRDAVRVKPLMQQYYMARHSKDPVSGSLVRSGHFRLGVKEVLVQAYVSSQPGQDLDVVLIAEGGGPFLLDWESYVAWGELSFQDLKQQRPSVPRLLRVFARSDETYHGEYGDTTKYLGVQLISPDGLYYAHAFCDRNSSVGTMLAQTMAGAVTQPRVTLTVAYPENPGPDTPLRILQVVADRWLVVR